ncbi:MAG: hypothetical protein MIO87_00650 [Methanomassiliicoccales archaeon]|nr:hypothetical protein [Methanomassiliicoccales archaeon]
MVSITEGKPLEHTLEQLSTTREVTILSCNTCAHYCGTGGRLAMDHLAFHLNNNGVTVVGKELVTKVCIQEQLRGCNHTKTIVLMACSSGLISAKEAWPDAVIVPTNTTLGIGSYDPDTGSATLLFPFPGHETSRGARFPSLNTEAIR